VQDPANLPRLSERVEVFEQGIVQMDAKVHANLRNNDMLDHVGHETHFRLE